jgi:hypothetical protein
MESADLSRVTAIYEGFARAQTTEDIVRETRSYLESWTLDELLSLPEGCRPTRVRSPQDIELWADRLLKASRRAQLIQDDERRLDRITNYFLIASVKLRQARTGRLVA